MSSFKGRVKYRGNVLIAFIPDRVTTSWAEKNNFYGHFAKLKNSQINHNPNHPQVWAHLRGQKTAAFKDTRISAQLLRALCKALRGADGGGGGGDGGDDGVNGKDGHDKT